MTFRRAALGLFRTVWLTAAWTAVTIAALYVFIATPAGTWIVARLAERELSRVAGIEADIRGLRTDLFTHVRLGRSTLALPDGTTRISVDRVVLRYSLIGIVRGLAGSVERVDVDGLSATIEASGEETPDDALPFEWSVKPYAPFAPQYVAVDKCELAIVEGDEATRFALETARFTVGEPGADSSLAISAIMQGALPGGERIGELPFRIVANVALADSSLHVLDLTASAPGFECRASGQMADLTTGPYVADIDLSVLLDEIPSAAADVELSGLVRLAGGVEWSESPRVDLALESSAVVTPWVTVAEARVEAESDSDGQVRVEGEGILFDGALELDATLPMSGRPDAYSARVELRDIDIAQLADVGELREVLGPDSTAGRLDLVATAHGRLAEAASAALSPLDSLRLALNGRDVVASGLPIGSVLVEASQRGEWVQCKVAAAGASFDLSGSVPAVDDAELYGSIDIPSLAALMGIVGVPDISGGMVAVADIRGSLTEPNVELHAGLVDPRYQDIRLPDIVLDAYIDSGRVLRTHVSTIDSIIFGHATLIEDFTRIESLNFHIERWPIWDIPGGVAEEFGMTGAVTLDVSGSGEVDYPYLHADVSTTRLRIEDQELGSLSAKLDYTPESIDIEAANDAGTLEIVGFVDPDLAAESHIVTYWSDLSLGPMLAWLTGQDISRVAGVSAGTVSMTWRDPIVDTFTVRARVERVAVRLGRTTYELANPPARFGYHADTVDVPDVTLTGDGQLLRVRGMMTRDGAIDVGIQAERVALGTLLGVAAGEDVDLEGVLDYEIDVRGTIARPTAEGRVQIDGLRWRSLAIDTVGATIDLRDDLLRVPDIIARFPDGAVSGSFMATLSSLGVPIPTKVAPSFAVDLEFDRVGAHIEQWEGLRPGSISASGAFRLAGEEFGDVQNYRGIVRADSLEIKAPFGRAAVLVHPVVAHIDPDSARVLSRPVQLAQVTGRDTLGIIEMTERHTDAAHELGVSVFLLDLAHVRHMVLPALSLAETSIPDDLGGLLMLDAVWDLNSDGPLASGRMRVVEPSGYGAAADSIIARFDLDADEFRIRSARVRSGGDALTVSGGIGTTTDSIGIHVRTRRLDLVRVLEPLLPPLKRIEPPAPWPSALPIPGATQHLQSLPTSMSGEELNRPLAAFDALLRAGHPMPDHGLAATLPLYADIWYGGPSSSPLLSGSAGFVGGFLDLQAIVEPFWFLDSLLVRFDGRMLRVPEFPVSVGTEGREIRLASTYSLDDGEFDLRVLADHARFTVISADQVALPRLLRRLKLGPVISPILDARVTDPIGTFTLDTDIHWRGNADASQLTGDVQLYRSIFSYPLPEAQDMLASMASSTTVTSAPDLMPNVDMHIAITTEDSLVIENNISNGATAGFQLALHGFGEYPKLQGDAGVSSGSPIRYFGRDFIVSNASISFQDPDVFEPTVDATATANFVGADGETPFRVEFTASGAFPDRFVTEMVAYEGPENEQTVILDQQQILKILLFGSSEFALQADQRFNNFLSQRGYGAASAALGTMLPLDRVSVQERELESSADADDTQSVTELELAQSFRFFGQTVRVSMATPVGEISQFGYQRAEARWYILQRPRLMRNLESLSLTFGTQAPDETGDVVAKETSLDVQVRIRF